VELDQVLQPGQLLGYSGNPDGSEGSGNDYLHLEVRPADDRQVVVNPPCFMGDAQQAELDSCFAGDYEGEDSPIGA